MKNDEMIEEMAVPQQSEFTQKIEQMFGEIAPTYDFLNHFLSFGIDVHWRHKTAKALRVQSGTVLLDVATGTGDTLKQLVRLGPRKIVGVDITQGMLDICAKKVAQQMELGMIELYCCSAYSLPFPDSSFDGATVTFGVRNFDDKPTGLKEIARVLRPGSRLAIAELTTPKKKPFSDLYEFYFKKVLPFIGGMLSRNFPAYKYLPDSVTKFPDPAVFCKMMEDAGFEDVYARPLTFGVCMLYVGKKK
jgi:demethylmenaquinone methyltransferase/2-methoxy-6-polyprenyl-1,4-benzoquinol methylase